MESGLEKLIVLLSGFGSQKMQDIGILGFIFLMCIALFCSFFISYLYLHFYNSRATGSQIHRAFPLLGISVTGIFICIQFSLPLSLGLLGALSIVRFRTPIKEPEEIGFIMLIVTVSIACATFNMILLGIILSVAVGALVVLKIGPRFLKESRGDGLLMLTLSEGDYINKGTELMELLNRNLSNVRVESMSKDGDQSIISYSFTGLGKNTLLDLQSELSHVVNNSHFNIFFNRPEAV